MSSDEIEMVNTLQQIFQLTWKMADDTQSFIWAIRRAMIADAILMTCIGLVTALNFWMLHRAMTIMRDVLKLVHELIDKETR